MNKEELDHIAKNPGLITAQQAIELSELCQKFPWFSTPFLLLASYYHKQGDYRANDMLQHAALKSSDRGRLYQLLHPAASNGNESVNSPESKATEQLQTENQYTSESAGNEQVSAVEAVPVIPDGEPKSATEFTETDTTEPSVVNITDGLESVPALIEPADAVYDEILPFSGNNEPSESTEQSFLAGDEAEMAELESDWEKLPDAGGLIVPEKDDFTTTENTTDSTANGVNNSNEINEESGILTIEPKEDELKPKLIRQAAVYDIEQYYSADKTKETEESDDFFSWLKKPVIANDENLPTNTETHDKTDLIDRFIKTNPSISRPQKDFFIPETAAKKSEHMPDHLATETLAKVFLSQQKPQDAIRIYERLLLKFPEKKPYFAALIEKTRKEYNL